MARQERWTWEDQDTVEVSDCEIGFLVNAAPLQEIYSEEEAEPQADLTVEDTRGTFPTTRSIIRRDDRKPAPPQRIHPPIPSSSICALAYTYPAVTHSEHRNHVSFRSQSDRHIHHGFNRETKIVGTRTARNLHARGIGDVGNKMPKDSKNSLSIWIREYQVADPAKGFPPLGSLTDVLENCALVKQAWDPEHGNVRGSNVSLNSHFLISQSSQVGDRLAINSNPPTTIAKLGTEITALETEQATLTRTGT